MRYFNNWLDDRAGVSRGEREDIVAEMIEQRAAHANTAAGKEQARRLYRAEELALGEALQNGGHVLIAADEYRTYARRLAEKGYDAAGAGVPSFSDQPSHLTCASCGEPLTRESLTEDGAVCRQCGAEHATLPQHRRVIAGTELDDSTELAGVKVGPGGIRAEEIDEVGGDSDNFDSPPGGGNPDAPEMLGTFTCPTCGHSSAAMSEDGQSYDCRCQSCGGLTSVRDLHLRRSQRERLASRQNRRSASRSGERALWDRDGDPVL